MWKKESLKEKRQLKLEVLKEVEAKKCNNNNKMNKIYKIHPKFLRFKVMKMPDWFKKFNNQTWMKITVNKYRKKIVLKKMRLLTNFKKSIIRK